MGWPRHRARGCAGRCCKPPRLLRVISCIWMAMNGPAAGLLQRCRLAGAQLVRAPTGARAGCGGSGRRCAALAPLAKLASKASAVACSTAGRHRARPVSAFILAASPASVSSTRKVRALGGHLLDQPVVAQQGFFQESGNCMSRMRWLCSAPEMANSLAAMRQFSRCQVQGFSCAATRWHSQWVSKPVTSGSGPMRSPRWLSHSADLQGMVDRPCPSKCGKGMRKTGGVVPHLAGVGDLRPPSDRPPGGAACRRQTGGRR
jgi:hypothetical protein